MADAEPQKSAEEKAAEEQMLKAMSGEPGAAGGKSAGGGKWFLIACVGVVALAAGVGYLAASLPTLLSRAGPSQAAAETTEPEGGAATADDKHEGKADAKADAKADSKPPAKESPKPAGKDADKGVTQGGEFTYYDFEAVVANLDEPRLARYVRVVVTLAVKRESFSAAQALLEKKKPELRHWLTIYFSNCKLDDVRGAPNLNRIQREILDALNNQLWPNQKPLVDHVLFKEFAVS